MYRTFICTLLLASAWQSANAAPSNNGAIEEIVVTAHPLSGEGLAQASTLLEGEQLQRKLAASIGATLAQEPGIHSAQFGAAVGRPVIHGLGGPRVRIMEDRIDALDLSVTSADHAVAIDPFVADRIEVLKGSSTLLYGSGAIGGVVDVHTGRIPHRVPDELITGGIETRYDDNTDGTATVVKLNGGGGSLAWHLDGTWKDGDDYEIPGATGADGSGVRGLLPGSAFDSRGYAGGVSYIGSWGFAGLSLGRIDADYGLPGAQEAGEPAVVTPTLDMEQTRTDLELGLNRLPRPFTALNVRLGINDYQHRELEPDGGAGTRFANDAWELRAEVLYQTAYWSGAVGVQHSAREFFVQGEEAFVPPVDTTNSGIFWVTERDFDRFSVETGVRLERVEHRPDGASSESFNTIAGSLGFVIPLSATWDLGLITDYSSRAPVSEELFSNGPHLVTDAFELGDATLDSEQAINAAATLTYTGQRWNATVTAYATRFSDFIYQQATGAVQDGLPVFQFQQNDARFIGLDLQLRAQLHSWDAGELTVHGLVDTIRARLDVHGNDHLPRIPPTRWGLGAELRHQGWHASIDYGYSSRQSDVAAYETVTDRYEDLRAFLGYDLPLGNRQLALFVAGRNLTDDEQRPHTSFIKAFAPAPGRTLELGLRLTF